MKHRGHLLVGIVAILLLTWGCEKSPSAPPSPSGTTPLAAPGDAPGAGSKSAASELAGESGYQVETIDNAGSLSVAARYTGDPVPEQTKVPVNINVDVCGDKVVTENIIVDSASRGLKNVVVRLEGISRGKATPEVVTITNRDCSFVPHVAVAMPGTKLQLKNDDQILHTTHPFINGKHFFNKSLTGPSDTPRPRPIPRTGVMEIICDVHKWMRAYIVIHSNPYAAVTDAQGKLSMEGIPPGKYSYVAWHEQLPEQSGEVEIVAGKAAELTLEYTSTE